MAKFNIEVELDWVDEESGYTIDEEIKEQVVSGVKDALLRKATDEAVQRVDKVIADKILEAEETIQETVDRFVNMTITTAAMALHDGFGFGKDRLKKWKSVFDKKVEHAMNIDWLGEHYVSFEDYANYLNELYDVGIDINVLTRVQKTNDALIPGYRQASVDRILEILKDGGFDEAAEYLDKKVR